jgi:hypothetical protein
VSKFLDIGGAVREMEDCWPTLPIEASNRIAHNVNPTGVGRTNDYVERTNARMSDFAAKTWPAAAPLNMDSRVTYNPSCGIPHNRICGSRGVKFPPATRPSAVNASS